MIMTESQPRQLSRCARYSLLLLAAFCISTLPLVGNRTLPATETAPNEPQSAVTQQRPTEAGSAADTPEGVAEAPKTRVRGRVIGPDGRPAQGAKIWLGGPPRWAIAWARWPQEMEWTLLTMSGSDGKFEAIVNRSFRSELQANPHAGIRVAATADGFGWAWADVRLSELSDEVSLQLDHDVPINGRILTADGEPAVGVTITVNHIPSTEMKPDEIKKAPPGSTAVYTNSPPWPGGGPTFSSVVTDAEGRFRIEGMGAARYVRLETFGGGVGATRLAIITHPTPAEFQPNGAVGVREGLSESTYFANFTHVAAPARTLRGRITDAENGSPIPGVRITSKASWHTWTKGTTTDEDGRYEFTNIPKSNQYRVEFESRISQHFNKELVVMDAGGLEPLEVNVELGTGIPITGRVTDSVSRKPVRGTVAYHPLYLNDNVVQLGESIHMAASSTQIAADGTYELSVLQGPGVIAMVAEGGPYVSPRVDVGRLRAVGGDRNVHLDEHGDPRFLVPASGRQRGGPPISVRSKHALALVNPTSEAPFEVDLQVIIGHSRQATVVDDSGKPLIGAKIVGSAVTAAMSADRILETANFTVEKLAPGRKRSLLLFHRERQLGAKIVISGDERTPLTVHTKRTGTITGRLVDEFGEPLQDVQIELVSEQLATNVDVDWAPADDDGRFRITGLIEGCSYGLRARLPEIRIALNVKGNIIVSSGETRDLGAFTPKNQYQFREFTETADE